MNYNDYGHLRQDAKDAALGYQIGPKSVITFPSGGQQLPGRGFYEISGLAWSGGGAIRKVEVSTDGGKHWKDAEIRGTAYRMAHTRFSLSLELGRKRDRAPVALHGRNRPGSTVASPGRQVLQRARWIRHSACRAGQHHSAVEDRQRWERAQWDCLGFSRLCCSWGRPRWRSRPRMVWDARRRAEEIRAWDISIGPTGAELPPGRGTAKEGAQALSRRRDARDATGRRGQGARLPF